MVALAGWVRLSAFVIESLGWLNSLAVGKGTAVSYTGVIVITPGEVLEARGVAVLTIGMPYCAA